VFHLGLTSRSNTSSRHVFRQEKNEDSVKKFKRYRLTLIVILLNENESNFQGDFHPSEIQSNEPMSIVLLDIWTKNRLSMQATSPHFY